MHDTDQEVTVLWIANVGLCTAAAGRRHSINTKANNDDNE